MSFKDFVNGFLPFTAEDSFAVQKNDQRAESENSEDDEIITLFHGL